MSYKYFELKATNEKGEQEVIFGSYLKHEVISEKDCEKESLKEMGYKKIVIKSREVEPAPDACIYGELATKDQLWRAYAPSFNFELDKDELLQTAFDRDFVSYADEENQKDTPFTLYLINPQYITKEGK